jgi:amino acid adenylation domain-containing protein
MSAANGGRKKITQLQKKISALNQRDELLAYLLEYEGFERQSEYTIPRRDNDDAPPPPSFSQERFWFLDQFEHARPVYNGCKVVRLVGELRAEILEECLNIIVRRHEVLRTTYPAPDGNPIQRIAASCSIEITVTDLEEVAAIDLPSAIKLLIRNAWLRPIDLSEELPIRARLARIDHARHLLILTLHQMVFDSQSVAIFFRELWTAYEAILTGKEPQLAALPVQYADFASWQRRRIASQTFQAQREYWIQRLSGTLPVLNLPTDKPRPPVQGFDGSRLSVQLPETLQLKLKELSRDNGVTLFVTLLAAFKTLLYRYTAQEDLVVGCPMLNRRLPETENLLGSFVNTLVLRTSYSGNPSFRETLRRVRETCVGAFAHQDFPFEKLVEELQPQRDLARNPIFQVMFAFQNTAVPALELAGLRSDAVEIDGGMTKFDFTFSLIDKEHGIAGHIEYSTDLFHRDTIERMARHFQILLEAIVADPDQSIATLPILTEAERHQILVEWNDTAADYPKDQCIHELFEAQVERTPEAIALEFEGSEITYRELNRRANQLAHYLISLGIGPEKLVGICVERSIEMVVGLMGILKAGGAYVPLDPSYPKERLRFMLEDSQVSVLLTQEKLVEDRAWRPVLSPSAELRINSVEGMEDGDPRSFILAPRLQVVFLDRDWPLIRTQGPETPATHLRSDNLAYVIYTSGSTGQPKGVQVSHRSVMNCLHSISRRLGFARRDVLLAVTTISFDIAGLELYLPLLIGGAVVVASHEKAEDGNELLRWLEESSATAMQATPSTWRLLVDAGWQGSREFKILCGGEVLSRDLAKELLARSTVWNLYGPTETTIWSTLNEVEPGERPVFIGRPIANTQIYILDSHLQPVPIGVHGEIYVGGDGLALGYLNCPELNTEKFIPNPFSEQAESRLYRTGDMARYRPDGNIEFLGRIDNQVKIRGHRVEPGEVESVLNQHPTVKESVVVARKRDSSGENELIGYVVSTQESPASVSELRRFLRERLPDYMIPSWFVVLDALPLTPNSKIDRNALPPPDGERPQLDQKFVEPRSEIEELVAQIWREVLKLDKIGIHDNFFELGGHSLLATRVAARLRNTFAVDLALRKLFELSTVAALAEYIDHLRHSQSGTSTARITPVDRTQPFPLSFSQRRLWYLQKVDANLSAYNIPAAFRIRGDLDKGALEQALNEMIARHEVLRSCVKEVDGKPRQEISPSVRVALSVIDLTQLPDAQAETEAKRLSSTDARQLYDLAKGPLMRATLVKLAVDNHVFILNLHHIVADGSSLAILYKELAVLYEALRDNKTVSLPRLPVQYADYAAWQHEWLKSSLFDTQVDYWKRQLVGLPGPCALPTDFDRPTVQTYRGRRLALELSEELTRSLKILSRQQSVTMFMTLFATFNIMLSRISGQEDIVIGSTIAGRNHPETDGLIGFFINALPLRCDLAGDPNFVTLLQRVREICLDAYTNQDVPFEKIVEEIKPRREPGRNPVFDILFNIADYSERILTLAGCEVTKLAQVDPEAKFDIVLHAPHVGGKIELAIVYNTALFREGRISLLLEQWAALLDQVASHPDLPISQLSLLTDASRPVLPDPKEALDDIWEGAIHGLLAEQARRSPESLAVVDENQNWTYEEMNQCANRLANCLIDSEIRPKDLIAIYAHRSSSLIVALFGILKAGASFLILDPAYPAARTIDYLRIAQPKGWLQLQGSGEPPDDLLSFLDSLTMRCRMNVPQSKAEILQSLGACANTDPETIVTADDPAYVAFTSGSTGEPKGVRCRHGPITHFLPWQIDAFQLSEEDRFAMLSGLAYSHLHRDVFTALSLGATLYIPNPSEARSPEYLTRWLERNAITVLHLTPALGRLLLTSSDARLPSVRRVFFGGDVLTPEMVASIRRLAPNATVGSFYGATETQRAVGYFEIANDPAAAQVEALKAVPLGRGIKDVQLLVLNRGHQLASVGELGELYVRSPHLAGGYVKDDGRTNELFITNPFTNDPEDRLYKTGELARYLPDGNVEWAGRNDRRVNIRGFRVELEEIETVLKQHPAVQNAAVVLREFELPKSQTPLFEDSDNPKSKIENPKSDLRLVAYVAADEDQRTLADLLHAHARTRLPDYMIPAHFVILDRLPVTPNGKIDYTALPSPGQFLGATAGQSGEPRTPNERELVKIFAHVLGREKVGIDENFFRLGGHSLLAAQTAARIRESFGVSLELRTFLESPTVAALAKEIEVRLKPADATPGTVDTDREEIEL